jgi:uncharacterized protein (TIGR00106 family)
MSTLIEFSIIPLDKGDSFSDYVANILGIIKKSGLSYELGPMGTCVEGDYDQVMALVKTCFDELQKKSQRISMSLKLDYRKGKAGRIKTKVRAVEAKLK